MLPKIKNIIFLFIIIYVPTYGQDDFSRTLFVQTYADANIEVSSLLATIKQTGVYYFSDYHENFMNTQSGSMIEKYKYIPNVLSTLNRNMLYCTRIIKSKYDTTYIYIYTGENGIFREAYGGYIKDLTIDSFNFSRGTYFINFDDSTSYINKLILSDIRSKKRKMENVSNPFFLKQSSCYKELNRLLKLKNDSGIINQTLNDSIDALNNRYRDYQLKLSEIQNEYNFNYLGYYYFSKVSGLHISGKATTLQKISSRPISPGILQVNIISKKSRPLLIHKLLQPLSKTG